jgi:hypothetical protein
MENLNKLKIISVKDLDKSSVFIMVDSNSWKIPNKITIKDLIDNISISKEPSIHIVFIEPSIVTIYRDTSIFIIQREPSIIEIKTPFPEIKYIAPSVFSEPFCNQDISINLLPKNASELSAMHMMVDENYLYVWVKNRWKRVPITIW